MPWSFSGLYTQATPRAMTCLKDHPVLGPALHHLRRIGGSGAPALPRGGLLALPDFGPPDAHRLRPEVPWDALLPVESEGRRAPRISFADPREVAELRERGLSPGEAPPRPTLVALKQLSLEIGAPLVLYRCEMWGGDVDLEVAWIPGWAAGEVDRLFVHDPRERSAFLAVGGALRPSPGDVLVQALEYLRLRLPSPYFAPHTSRFDWDACRLAPAPERRHPSPPVHPRSLLARVYAGDLVGARALLDAGADPNAYGWTRPLAVAAELGRVDLVELLLDRAAEIAPKSSLSALHSATDAACARLLLDRGAPLEGADDRVITPLASAARRGDDGVVRLLLERGASLRPPGREGLVWVAACRGGLAWLVRRLLDTGAAAAIDRRVHGDTGETGLMAAAAAGRGEVAALLVRRGATLDVGSLIAAAEGGLLEIVREHLERGLDVDSAFFGRSPLSAAIAGGHVDVVRLLLDRGADPTVIIHGRGHLHRAAEVGVPALIDLLLERYPDRSAALRLRDHHGWTPLFAAVWYGHQAAAQRLIAAGAEVDLVDKSARSLLEMARERGLDLGAASRPRSGGDSEAGEKPR